MTSCEWPARESEKQADHTPAVTRISQHSPYILHPPELPLTAKPPWELRSTSISVHYHQIIIFHFANLSLVPPSTIVLVRGTDHCRVSTDSATASFRTLSFCWSRRIPPDKHDYSVLFPFKRSSLSSPHLNLLHHPHSDQVSSGWTGGSFSPWKT
jgi:hypothetical protein